MLDTKGIEPAYRPLNSACEWSGLSRSEMYRRLASGELQAKKAGRSTLIDMDSLRALLASLPAATFRQPSPV